MPFPGMTAAFWGLQDQMQFRLVSKEVVDFVVKETPGSVPYDFGGYDEGLYDSAVFTGVFQPIPETRLMVKPEGQRQWKWWRLWTTKRLSLDDIVVDKQGRNYRVMRASDWSGGGYQEFQLTEGINPLDDEG